MMVSLAFDRVYVMIDYLVYDRKRDANTATAILMKCEHKKSLLGILESSTIIILQHTVLYLNIVSLLYSRL